jgi:type IV pilus assembly protein PilQ
MRNWTRTTGLLFLAAASVYSDPAIRVEVANAASPASSANPGETDVRLIEDTTAVANDATDPFAATAPTTVPAAPSSVSSSEVNLTDDGTVEIHVNEANLVEVLRMLSLQSQKNIVASKEVRGTVTANLYDVTVREALDAILHANGYAYREKGNFIYVYSVKEIQEMEKAERRPRTQLFRLYYTPAANAVNMIKPVLSPDAQVSVTTPASSGIEKGTDDMGGNEHATEDIIVVNDYPENLERVKAIIDEVDRRPQQILIEATILRAALKEDNALGVDFNFLGGVNFTDVVFNGAGQLVNGVVDSPVAYSEPTHSVGSGNNYTNNIQGGMKVGFVSSNVSVFLAALEGITDTTVLANPKVLTLNKQRGEITVGREDGYQTTTVTESASTQTVEFLKTGTRLVFRPYIGNDGYIRMEVHPEDSSGGLQTAANLPFKITTEVTANVMVRDGHTIVIGGLFRESSEISRAQTPFLGNLPLAGPLFRQQRDVTTREEVIILLTPHIIKDDAAYARASEEELANMEKLRVGTRRGMMPWGRERLAESWYDCAVQELAKENPSRKKALFYLNCATNLNPKFLEAMNLKQTLTGEQLSSVDNSSIRTFIKKQMLADARRREGDEPAEQVVPIEPATKPADEAPATQPVVDEDIAAEPRPQMTEAPATQPTTQPVAAADDVIVEPAEGMPEPLSQESEISVDEPAMTEPEFVALPDATEAHEMPEMVEAPKPVEAPEAVEAPELAEMPEAVEAEPMAEAPVMAEADETVEVEVVEVAPATQPAGTTTFVELPMEDEIPADGK